jgi:hypothetical protein
MLNDMLILTVPREKEIDFVFKVPIRPYLANRIMVNMCKLLVKKICLVPWSVSESKGLDFRIAGFLGSELA